MRIIGRASLMFLGILLSSSQVALRTCENGKFITITDYKTLCVPMDAELGECPNTNDEYLKLCESLMLKHNLSVCLPIDLCLQSPYGSTCMFDTDCESLKCRNNICDKQQDQR